MTTWIADGSQVTRLGIISVLKQLDYQHSIRELSTPEKLKGFHPKTSSSILIISSSFIFSWKSKTSDWLEMLLEFPARLLILDQEAPESLLAFFDEIIHLDDAEKNILRKINMQIERIRKKSIPHRAENGISDREKEVLRLVAMGLTNKEIAEKLYISTHTVIAHRKNITAKLGIKTIAGLSVYAVINKLISIDDIH